MIRRIMQVEIEPEGDSEFAIIRIRDPRTGIVLFSFMDPIEKWVPNE